jgi:outer membrane biosynthesis protein TonB
MPWFHEFLTSISHARARSRPRLGIRVLAASLSVVLVFGSIAPGVAFAGEADSEQEGSAPPGALPGLEEGPELESGGEETPLEELPGIVGAGVEAEEGPPLETEPAQEAELPPAPPEEPVPQTEPPVASEEPASAPSPGPEYETATEPPPAAPVENQALTAPESSPPAHQNQAAPEAVQASPETSPPASPPEEAPPPEGGQPPAVPVQRDASPGSLAGHRVHVVRAGECLWSIAEALLPAGANTAEVAAEVQRLWRLNASRIGTGDPSLVFSGTELTLR